MPDLFFLITKAWTGECCAHLDYITHTAICRFHFDFTTLDSIANIGFHFTNTAWNSFPT